MKRQSRLDFSLIFFLLGVLSIPGGVSEKESERRIVCGAKSEHSVFLCLATYMLSRAFGVLSSQMLVLVHAFCIICENAVIPFCL